MNPMVSMIIPVYNVEKYLRTTLNSVINQRLQDFEVIAINDGSTDSSLDILKEYANNDSRIRVIAKENSGVSDTRNKGIEAATGKYLCFVDSDDLLSPYYLEKLVSIATETQADMVVCNYKTFHKAEECFRGETDQVTYRELENGKELLQTGLMTSVYTKLIRRELINKYDIRFRYGMAFGEDLFFCWKAYEASEMVFITDDVLYGYRMGIEGASRKYHANLYETYKESFQELKNFCKSYGFLDENNSLEMDIYFVKRLPALSLMSAREKVTKQLKVQRMNMILQDEVFKNILNEHWNDLVKGENEKQRNLYQSAKAGDIHSVIKYGKVMEFRIRLSRLKARFVN